MKLGFETRAASHSESLRWPVVGFVLGMLVACSAPKPEAVSRGRLVPGAAADFLVLDMTRGYEFKLGTRVVADNQVEFEAAWGDFEFVTALPSVDFAHYRVWFFVAPPLCDGGDALELAALDSTGDTLTPVFIDPGVLKCYAIIREGPELGVVYAVAVRRRPAPETGAPLSSRFDAAQTVLPTPCSDLVEQYGPSSEPFAHVGQLPRGSVQLSYLADGQPLWIVHHADGTRSALPADYPLDWLRVGRSEWEDQPSRVRGVRVAVHWNCRTRRFEAGRHEFDEYGVPTRGMTSGFLPRYELLRVGARWQLQNAAPPPATISPQPGFQSGRPGLSEPSDVVQAYALSPEVPLKQLLNRRPGERVLVDSYLWLGPGRSARLCDVYDPPWRGEFCVPVAGAWSESDRTADHRIDGPIVVRVQQGYVSEPVSLTGWGRMLGWRAQPRSDDLTRYRNVRVQATLAQHFGAGDATVFAGAGFRLSATKPLLSLRSLPRLLVGNRLGLAVTTRALWLDQVSTRASVWTGLAPLARNDESWFAGFARWELPSLLGLALPELGLVSSSDGVEGYLTWSALITHRQGSLTRQRPYTLREVLAFELGPTFTLNPVGDTTPWFAGVSVGVGVW